MRRLFWFAAGVVFAGLACNDNRTINPSPNPGPTGPAAVASYLDELTRIMRAEAANAAQIDWDRFRADVGAAASGAGTIPAAYPAIELALRLLNDFESHYVAAKGQLIGPSPEPACTLSPAVVPPLPDTIGYVKVNGCPCDGAAANAYAEALQAAIMRADRPRLTGWIVDLREDGGGNMWPMIAGLGPILGEGIIGWIVYNNREYEREYRNGAALSLGELFAQVGEPYTLMRSAPRVAVLTGGGTNSAGEAITVWFKGRADTRSFGTATCGHHHLLATFLMSDGARLTLKNAHNADRLKRTYAGPVAPDETVGDPAEAAERAVSWLANQR
jgi:carboxyl-terminal processing protease